ncbi:hypothetical protein [Streptomyces buecherae]|uniref:hypothetical protein n=1 Tax=Streptomyces buecherae TaxID=2763006 RepID=UPI0036AFB72F
MKGRRPVLICGDVDCRFAWLALRKVVGELRTLGYLSPDATTASGAGERLVAEPAPAAAACLIPQSHNLGLFADES